MKDVHKFIQQHAVMFSEANATIRGISNEGTEIFIPINSDDPISLRDEFQQLLEEA